MKSKRHCEGYNQRVIFKPTFDFRPVANGGAHITFQASPAPAPPTSYQNEWMRAPVDAATFPDLRPRPAEAHMPPSAQGMQHYPAPQLSPQYYPIPGMVPMPRTHAMQPQAMAEHHPGMPAVPIRHHSLASDAPPRIVNGNAPDGRTPRPTQPYPTNGFAPPPPSWDPQRTLTESQAPWDAHSFATTNGMNIVSPTSTMSSRTWHTQQPPIAEGDPHCWTSPTYAPRPELTRPFDYQPPSTHPAVQFQLQASMAALQQSFEHPTPEFYEYESQVSPTLSPNYVLSEAAVEAHDDDYYDVQSDDEMDFDIPVVSHQDLERQQSLTRMLQMNQISVQDLQTRRYDTFIFDGMLDRYRVERVANPLRNPATARVFAHFISVTGPSLSIFERHPRNTSVLFTEGQIPFSQQGLWTYTMPVAALHHQGLLHAMLALASLHIARLTGASVTPSIQHYAWALKRIHHCVGHSKKRLKLSTIAASMLLGFYEIMTADHMKWNMHLAGSKQLFVETDFVRMTRQFKRMKTERAARLKMGGYVQADSPTGTNQDDLLAQIHDVDERLISELVGREVRYDDHGEIMTPQSGVPQELDLYKFEMLKDLYWWYCKQDAYQSIISGNPLL